jgi:inner membrane protein
MDSITHIVLGATIGEAMAGKKLGKRALLLGAVAQSLPDIDFVASSWLDTSRDVWVHRGITHSFLFVLLMTPLLTWIAQRSMRIGRRGGAPGRRGGGARLGDARSGVSPMTRRDWWIFFSLQLFVHIFIDAFNAYGTGWFEPFSSYRVSFNVLFVADPFYSCWLGISFLALLILKSSSPARKTWVRFGLLLSSAYLCYCLGNKWWVDTRVERDLQEQAIRYDRYFTTPTPLNSWLWYVVAENSAGYHIGYRSVFDSRSDPFRWAPRNDSLLQPFRGHGDVQYLLRFAGGYYTVEQWKGEGGSASGKLQAAAAGTQNGAEAAGEKGAGADSLVFNVLRFGEMRGWEGTHTHFVFHYFLQYPGDNDLVVQRGRFAGWNRESLLAFIRRIRGN